jgi:hypothetical protein
MSNHRQTTASGPSLVSVIVMALATLAVIATSTWVLASPDPFRQAAGGGLGFLLALVLMAQTMGRAYERVATVERAANRKRRFAGAVPPEEPDHVLLEHWASGGELDPMATQPLPVDDCPTQVIHMRY